MLFETGQALAWVAVPMFAVVWLVAWLVIYTNSRLILALGLAIVAVGCWSLAHLDTSWAGSSFRIVELFLSAGFACTYIGLVSSIVLEALEAGALTSAAKAATFSGFMHFIRIFGGQVGVAAMTRFLSLREKFHSNLLGLHVEAGDWLTDERIANADRRHCCRHPRGRRKHNPARSDFWANRCGRRPTRWPLPMDSS